MIVQTNVVTDVNHDVSSLADGMIKICIITKSTGGSWTSTSNAHK